MKVTAVTAVYNCERFLPQAIESVLKQTHKDFEYVLIDDGSSDRTRDIIIKYAKADPRIKPIYFDRNTGRCEAFNKGFESAQSEWVARLDADDQWLPDRLEKQIRYLENHDAITIIGSYAYHINENGKLVGIACEGPADIEEFKQLLRKNKMFTIIPSSLLLKRSEVVSVGGYRLQFVQAEDIDLLMRLCEGGALAAVLSEPLVKWRFHKDSVSAKKYFEQRVMFRWVRQCALCRRLGKTETPYNEFIEQRNKRSKVIILNELRKDYGKLLFKKAGLEIFDKKYLPGFFLLIIASIIHFEYVIPRLIHKKIYRNYNNVS